MSGSHWARQKFDYMTPTANSFVVQQHVPNGTLIAILNWDVGSVPVGGGFTTDINQLRDTSVTFKRQKLVP